MKVRVLVCMTSLAVLFALGYFVPPSWARAALGMPSWLLIGASLADAVTPLGLLNYCILQWLGVRIVEVKAITIVDGEIVNAWARDGGGNSIDNSAMTGKSVRVGWRLLRWVVPLTGWWDDYRYIARRP